MFEIWTFTALHALLMPSAPEGGQGPSARCRSRVSAPSGHATRQNCSRDLALSGPPPGVCPSRLPARSGGPGTLTGEHTARARDQSPWPGPPRDGTRVDNAHGHAEARMAPTGAPRASVNPALWHQLPPRDVARRLRRGDEADVEALGCVVGQPPYGAVNPSHGIRPTCRKPCDPALNHHITIYLTHGGQERISQHQVCPKDFSQTRGFIFFDLCTTEEKVMIAVNRRVVCLVLAGISCLRKRGHSWAVLQIWCQKHPSRPPSFRCRPRAKGKTFGQ
jgi:hypothetical protein